MLLPGQGKGEATPEGKSTDGSTWTPRPRHQVTVEECCHTHWHLRDVAPGDLHQRTPRHGLQDRRPVDAMGWRCYDSVLAGRSRRHRTSWQTFHEAQAGRDPQKSKGVPELSLRDSRQRLWTLQRPGHMGKGSDTAPARAWLRPPLIRPHVFLLPGPQQGRKFCTLRHFDLLRGRLSTYLQPQVSLRQVLPEVRMGITRTPGARQALHLQGKADQPC